APVRGGETQKRYAKPDPADQALPPGQIDRGMSEPKSAEQSLPPSQLDRGFSEPLKEGEIVIRPGDRRRDDRQQEQDEMSVHPPMFWSSLPGLKRIVRPGGSRTSLPVRGLRPIPRLRGFTWKTPKPRSSMRSPRCIESRMASKTASTASSAFTFVTCAARDTSLTMSTLIMLRRSETLITIIK